MMMMTMMSTNRVIP